MRFLIVSYSFLPSLGGQETASLMLAEELVRRGHQVDMVTATPDGKKPALPFAVHHRPGPLALLGLHRHADAVIHNGLALRFFWPLWLMRRPLLVIHLIARRLSLPHRLALRRACNVAVSGYIAAVLPLPATVIPNAYRAEVFSRSNDGARDYDLAFLGRLVSDKGALLLLQALLNLQRRGLRPRCLVIGNGPEEGAMRDFVARHGLAVEFAGPQFGQRLAQLLNQVRVLVVPSLWQEPFGIVALEGIACGCAVIGSSGGGLPEAIGPCGMTFPNGDADALADAIARLLGDPASIEQCRAAAPAHLAQHTPQAIVDHYLQALGLKPA